MNLYHNENYAVRFGESVDMGKGTQKAFPFIYNFIPSDKDEWESVKAAATAANLTGIGPTVPSGGTIQHPVTLDPDYNFKLLWIKYTAYWFDPEAEIYVWYEPIGGWTDEQGDYQTKIGTPLVNSLRIKLSAYGPDSRILYGDFDMQAASANAINPAPVEALQGYDFGWGQLRTPYLLPREGLLMFEITNEHAIKDLVVGAAIYGMKIRL